MKKLMIFACSLMAGVSAYAQDVLITNNGDVKNVYEVEVGTNAVFYKSEDKADAAILRINKADVFMIKRKDGTKYDLGNGAQPSSAVSSTPSPAQASSPAQQSAVASQGAPQATVSAASQKRSEELIAYSNTYAPEYVGKKGGNAGLLYAVIGYGEDSQLVNDDIEIITKTGQLNYPNGLNTKLDVLISQNGVNKLTFSENLVNYDKPAMQIQVKNKTNRTIYIDLGNSFFLRNGIAEAYYIPSSSSSSQTDGSGVGVNLGAVAGALGVGGAIGTLASGIGVGSNKSNTTVNTTYSQRVIAIPPMSIKSLDPQLLFKSQTCNGFKIEYFPYRQSANFAFRSSDGPKLQNGETLNYTRESSPLNWGCMVSYSFAEDCSTISSIAFNYYMRSIIGFPENIVFGGEDVKIVKYLPDYAKSMGFIGDVNGMMVKDKTTFPRK